jgi:DNA-binding NtrC family response regulator
MSQTAPPPRILVVDDDRIIVESLTEFLRFEGFVAETAGNLRDALNAAERQAPDIILTDINMPMGNGFELLHVARKRFPDAVVIMLTGYGTIESAVEAIKLGAFDYLTKPVVDDDLKVCLQRALAQRAILQENRVLKDRLRDRYGLDADRPGPPHGPHV